MEKKTKSNNFTILKDFLQSDFLRGLKHWNIRFYVRLKLKYTILWLFIGRRQRNLKLYGLKGQTSEKYRKLQGWVTLLN